MKRLGVLRLVLCVMGLCVAAVPFAAGIHFQNLGTGAPPSSVGSIPVRPFFQAPQAAIANFTNLSSIPGSPVGGNISTSIAVIKLAIGSGWTSWSNGYTGAVYATYPSTSVTLTLPPGALAFYSYVEPDPYGTFTITAVTNSGVSSGPITVSGLAGANGFAFYTDDKDAIALVTISSSVDFAFGEFGISGGPGWAVVANVNDDTIDTIDLSTNTVYGPFLGGSLGSGELLEVAVTPDGHYALVSNFETSTVYRVDLTNPASPVLAGSVSLPILPEDIAISPDGTFAMVTDGSGSNEICVLNLSTFTLQTTYTVPGSSIIIAVAIAPDNQTWVAADYDSYLIFYGTYSLGGGFILTGSLPTPSPLNVTISPDGQTVLVANVESASVSAFSITGPGVLAAGNTVGALPASPQSIAFSPGGATAYVDSVSCPDAISWVKVTAPGTISLGKAGAASLPGFCGGTYYGVDGLAVTPDGQRVLVGNTGGASSVDLVGTLSFGVTSVTTPGSYPAGVAIFMPLDGSATSLFSQHFLDDYGRSDMCINSITGYWQYRVLKGNGAGLLFTGTGTVVNGSGYLRLTSMPGSGFAMNLIYYTTAHRATATFTYRPDAVSSALYDSNTLNDGSCP